MYDVWVMGNVLVWMVRIWDIIYRTRVGIGIVLIWLVLLEDLRNVKKRVHHQHNKRERERIFEYSGRESELTLRFR